MTVSFKQGNNILNTTENRHTQTEAPELLLHYTKKAKTSVKKKKIHFVC